ncbi:MAG: glycosyltransferase, partial [Candidatus Fonsibacter sp.]|nr:glycosyltransferase [Candidatus Fonsibacter sp.]
MKNKKEIAVLLPNKEDYSLNKAAAASIWVKDFNLGKIASKQLIFGISSSTALSKNFINLKKINLINNSYFYIKNFISKLPKSIKVIVIHNRPHFFFILKKKFPKIKFIIIFHNDPNTLRGSRSVNEKIKILENCDNIIFVSSFVKQRFYYNINNLLPTKGDVIYPSTNYYNHDFKKSIKKEKIIVFIGKLNSSKGYNFFGPAVINILNKNKKWRVIVAGNEKRETYNFYHERFKVFDWLPHRKIINIYKKSSISVVPSTWDEPFGRTAMESSDMGNALITSGRGGLKETTLNPIILKKVDTKSIENEIQKLVANPTLLKKIQKFNYNNKKINFKESLKKITSLKNNLIKKNNFKLNFIKNNNNKILHIANFDEKNDYRLSNINLATKISNGFIKEKFQTTNFSDRFFSQQNTFSNIDDKIINIIKNLKPNLILLGHTNSLKIETLKNIKDKFSEIKIAFWYEDSINKRGPDYIKNKNFIENYQNYVDQYFITTDKNNIDTSIPKKKLNFIPVPCSHLSENLNLYKTKNHEFDIFYAVSHGVNRGVLKKNKIDERYNFLKLLMSKSDDITYNIFGFNNIQPIWGDEFIKEISKCRFGLNLSRGHLVKYYSSNRIATLVANGVPTLIDEKIKYNDFFSSNEMIFYKDTQDLIDKVNFYKRNESKRIQIGLNGKRKYFKIFNNIIVADY